MTVPEIDLTDPAVLTDPFTAYGEARERGPVARLSAPGFELWAVTRYAEARAMLTDDRFRLAEESFQRPDVPEHCLRYMRTMGEMNGAEHARLRRLVTPSFGARRAAEFRPRVERMVDRLLDALPGHAEDGEVDLIEHFTRPLPIDVLTELVGVPVADRPRWREYGAAIARGHGAAFAEALPRIIAHAKEAVAARRADGGEDLLAELLRVEADGRLDDAEVVTFVWHLVLAGQTPVNLIANAMHTLLDRPELADELRSDPALMPAAVEELTRWAPPQLLTVPRFTAEDVTVGGTPIPKGTRVSVAIAAVNRDPRVFADPDTLDLRRSDAGGAHLAYGAGPHFCLGAPLARVQTEVALATLMRRFPGMKAARPATHLPDPGTWRLGELRVGL